MSTIITFTHEISIEDYNDLRASVVSSPIRPKRARVALANSLYTLIAMDGSGPGRDGQSSMRWPGYVYFICDVIVRPSYQSHGLGRQIIENVLAWLESQVEDDETIMVNLMSAMNKEPFYEKLGFHQKTLWQSWCRHEPLDFPGRSKLSNYIIFCQAPQDDQSYRSQQNTSHSKQFHTGVHRNENIEWLYICRCTK